MILLHPIWKSSGRMELPPPRQLLFILFITLAVKGSMGQRGAPTGPPKTFCTFKGKEYSPGDYWYPQATGYCISCVCLNNGRQNCTRQDCPSNCHIQRSPCCKSCEDGPYLRHEGIFEDGNQSPSVSDNTETGEESDDEDEAVVTENSEFVSCLHQGKIYKDGDSFTANVSGLPISTLDQCMQCVCQGGMVLCQMKSCTLINCPGTKLEGNPCCQRCSAWRNNKGDGERNGSTGLAPKSPTDRRRTPNSGQLISSPLESSITFRDVEQTREYGKGKGADDCFSGGRFYMHGTSWHPIIGPFGSMECVVCKCTRGSIDCGRLKCPPKKDLPCEKPTKIEERDANLIFWGGGHCCPICSGPEFGEGDRMCVPARLDVTAYQSRGFSNGTEIIQFAFAKQRSGGEMQIDLHEWFLREGEILHFSTKFMMGQEFGNLRNRHTFILTGATNDKNVEKFARREKRLEKRLRSGNDGDRKCNSRCSGRILAIERSLRIQRIVKRKQCAVQEREIST